MVCCVVAVVFTMPIFFSGTIDDNNGKVGTKYVPNPVLSVFIGFLYYTYLILEVKGGKGNSEQKRAATATVNPITIADIVISTGSPDEPLKLISF